jgi:hypothetical protein
MSVSRQLPSSIVVSEFGEVNVRKIGQEWEIDLTILMEPQDSQAEGWQTGVALDASSSMKAAYGRNMLGSVPDSIREEYVRNGWATVTIRDGKRIHSFKQQAHDDAVRRGYLRIAENIVEPAARDFISYLAGNLDSDGGTTVLYWACGDGKQTEVLGDFTASQCKSLTINGPKEAKFGTGTYLQPAMQYFVERFKDAKRGMYLFLTDGKLDDLDRVKRYTTKLAEAIQAGKRHQVKCVLIGIGESIDEAQMSELDDLDTGTDVDIWDHKIAKEMRSLVEIFAEVVDENMIVADHAEVFDDRNRSVKQFTNGMPAKISFRMPVTSKHFELEVGGQRVRQPLE